MQAGYARDAENDSHAAVVTWIRAAATQAFLAQAIQEGLTAAPRYLFCGPALSQTGGHGDPRPPELSCCLGGGHMAEVVDGVDALRRAARECLRSGAHAIKIMAWGGVISPRESPVCWRSICGGLLGGTRRYGLWRVAEDAPDSDLYAESSDVAALPATVGGRAVLDVLNDDRVL